MVEAAGLFGLYEFKSGNRSTNGRNRWATSLNGRSGGGRFAGRAGTSQPRTYAARFPLFALDWIWVHARSALTAIVVHNSPAARVESGHSPLVAELAIEAGARNRALCLPVAGRHL